MKLRSRLRSKAGRKLMLGLGILHLVPTLAILGLFWGKEGPAGASEGAGRPVALAVPPAAPPVQPVTTVAVPLTPGAPATVSPTVQVPIAVVLPAPLLPGLATTQPTPDTLGLAVADLTPQTAGQLGLSPSTRGVMVTAVRPGGPAARAGLAPGDLLLHLGSYDLLSSQQLWSQATAQGGAPLLLDIWRGGQILQLAVDTTLTPDPRLAAFARGRNPSCPWR